MIRVGLCLAMAAVRAGEDRVVVRIHMAGRTSLPYPGVRAGVNGEPCVVECRPQPARRGMACNTGRREV